MTKTATTKAEKAASALEAWRTRIRYAQELHDSWESVFHCRELHSKWAGVMQWTEDEDPGSDKYYVNLYFSGVETRRPALMFSSPRFRVRPRPSRLDDPTPPSEYRAKLYQDTINTIGEDRRVKMLRESLLAIHESFFRFGAIQVGLNSNSVENPRAGKPMMIDDEQEREAMVQGEPVVEPAQVVTEELPFVRRIPASQVLISVSNKNDTDANDWVGYWDWIRLEDVRSNQYFDKTVRAEVKPGNTTEDRSSDYHAEDFPDDYRMVKVYWAWDLRTHTKRCFADTGDDFLLQEKFTTLPLIFIRHHEMLDSWYPVPPTFNWLPQQREINDSREMLRTHRKRGVRKYTAIEGQLSQEAKEGLESPEDMTVIEVPRHDIIQPLADAPLGREALAAIPATKEDFMMVSGITGEQRGVQEAETATQANIIDVNSRLREGYSRQLVARFVEDIATTLLLIMSETASLPLWIKTNVDPTSPSAPMEAAEIQEAWQMIQSSNLAEAINFEVSVDMETLSPVVEDRERQNWNTVLQLVTNPGIALHMLASDVLLRKTLAYYGIRSEREVQEIKGAMGMVQTFMMYQQMLGAMGMPMGLPTSPTSGKPTPSGLPTPNGPQGGGPQGAGPGPTPDNTAIMGQIMAQLGGPQ